MLSDRDLEVFAQLPLAFWASHGQADEYRVVLWNDAASRLYGIPEASALGERFTSLFVADEAREQAEADADAVIDSGEHPINTIAIDYHRDSGKALILLTNVFRLVVDSTPLHAEISVDLTDSAELARYITSDVRKRIFTSNQRTVDYLLAEQRRSEQRRHLDRVASVAHEVRSELVIITRALESARPEARTLGIVASQRSSDYIETLLIHAQAASGEELLLTPRASNRPFVPNAVVEKVRDRHSNSPSVVDWTPAGPNGSIEVAGNPRDFELALSNILGNAVRHGERGAPIKIDSYVVLPRLRSSGAIKIVVSNRPRRSVDEVRQGLAMSAMEDLPDQHRFGLAVVRLLADTSNAKFSVSIEGEFVIASLDWPVTAATA
jgi:PAS domain S-box-containing protein